MLVTLQVPHGPRRVQILGVAERHLKLIRHALDVRITSRDGTVRIQGPPHAVAAARSVLQRLIDAPEPVPIDHLRSLISQAAMPDSPDDTLNVYAAGRPIRPRSPNQAAYLHAIRTHDLVFAFGPAGTGKTYLAVAAAVHFLRSDLARRIILVRPAVEAGERLGFLPGDVQQKVNPYLRPLFDALNDMIDYPTLRRFIESDVVEIAPLAYMRGRTLNDAVVILDEAQNTTRGQMQMFLTRLGEQSRMIVTGDPTQIDLPDPAQSGMIDAARRLKRVPGIAFVSLQPSDVVRHPLVQRIVDAYGQEPSDAQH